MNYLLDTHMAIWAIADSTELPAAARSAVGNLRNEIWVSAASIWEIAIKHAKRPEEMPISGSQALAYFAGAGFKLLLIEGHHAAAVDSLPAVHRDPFDRLLVAQAMVESMTLLTHDGVLAGYGDSVTVV